MTVRMETPAPQPRPLPEWLDTWLQFPFYGANKCQEHSRYYTVFCMVCMGEPFCEKCWNLRYLEEHRDHSARILQVCAASRRTAIEVEKIRNLHDISGIQRYICNGNSVVYLNPDMNKTPELAPGSKNCKRCARKIMESSYSFCSIACKDKRSVEYRNMRKSKRKGIPQRGAQPLPPIMEEEAANSEEQVLADNQNPNSVDAAIEPAVDGHPESTSNGNNIAESSALTNDDEREKTLEYADELMVRGSAAAKERDYAEATVCYSRALEIRAAHFGELAPECVSAYYKYGCALLYKAQEEADPLGSMPKKECTSQEDSNKESSPKITVDGESSAASVTNNADQEREDEEGVNNNNAEEEADGDEVESDLDLAWKMLDVARAIVEKVSGDTMEKVDILSALAEVALEREDVETSLSDYTKALFLLERLVEPDSRLIAELNFRICLCLEIGSKPEEAIPYCEKAVSVCKSRVQRLSDEAKNFSGSAEAPKASEMGITAQSSSALGDAVADRESEIETLTGLCSELEKKLEDLQQLVSNPKSILTDILGGVISSNSKAIDQNAASAAMSSSQMVTATTGGDADSPTVSTAHMNGDSGVTHLGVVGRGVKRVVVKSTTPSSTSKKPAVESSNTDVEGTS